MESTLSKRPFAHFLLGMCMGFGAAIIIDVVCQTLQLLYTIQFPLNSYDNADVMGSVMLWVPLTLYVVFLVVLQLVFKSKLATFGAGVGIIVGRVLFSLAVAAIVFNRI